MTRRLWRFVLACALVLALLPFTANGAARVIIISPHNESIRQEFGSRFAEWHQAQFGAPAEVEWRDVGGTSDNLRFVQSEFASRTGGIGIDIFFGGGSEPFLLLSDKKLALAYRPSEALLAGIPQKLNGVELYDDEFTWYGTALSSFGILENTRVQRIMNLPLVRSWEELTNPQLRGWVGAGDPRNSGTMTVMYEAILQAYGWERGWQVLTELGANVRKFDRVSSTTAKDVTLGETAYGLAIDFYAFTQIAAAGRTNLTFVLPQDFSPMSHDGIAILKGAPNLETAQRFVDFVLSEAGQKLWFLPRGHPEGPRQHSIERMSVRPDFYARFKGVSNIEFSPFELKQSFVYDTRLGRDRRDILAALVGALLIDTHSELQAAWRGLIERGLPETSRRGLGTMPLTESEALQMAREQWKDASFRNRKRIDWQRWAQEKYRRLSERRESSAETSSNPIR